MTAGGTLYTDGGHSIYLRIECPGTLYPRVVSGVTLYPRVGCQADILP